MRKINKYLKLGRTMNLKKRMNERISPKTVIVGFLVIITLIIGVTAAVTPFHPAEQVNPGAFPEGRFVFKNSGDAISAETTGSQKSGVYGFSENILGIGVTGRNTNVASGSVGALGVAGYGVYANSPSDHAIYATTSSPATSGVYGKNTVSGNVGYIGGSSYGVYGSSSSGYAGYFDGTIMLIPRSSQPFVCDSLHLGAIYYLSGTGFRGCTGAGWRTL